MTLQEYDRFFRKASHKNLTLTFSDGTVLTNTNIVSESLTIEESLCSEENLYYGACESSCLTIRIAYTEKSFKGLHLQINMVNDGEDTLFVDDSGDYFATNAGDYFVNAEIQNFNFGNYLVVSDVPTNDRSYRDLVCYDKMYEIADLDVSTWYKGLTFPMTLKAFRDSLFNHLNVTQETATLVNDSYSVVGGFSTDELLCRDVLVSICELNGVFGHIDKATGKFQYIELGNAETLEYPYYVNGTGAYEDYVTDKITGIRAKSAEDEVGTLVGTDTNLYTILGNLCLYGDEGTPAETTALTNLFNHIKNYQYRPFTVQTYGNPMLPLGTNVVFETTYQTVESFVMKKYLSGIQAMRDTLTATGDKVYPAEEARLTSQIQRLKGTSHKLVVDVNQLFSEIYNEDTGIKSTIQQLSDEVLLKVDANGKIVQVALSANPSTGTEFKVSADNISFIANGKIELTSNSLEINSTNFKVDASGNITATGAKITGDIVTTSLKIDNSANLRVTRPWVDTYDAFWENGEMLRLTTMVQDDTLVIDNSNYAFLVDSNIVSNAQVVGNTVAAKTKMMAPYVYIETDGYFYRMTGHKITLTDSTEDTSIKADIINNAKWDGTNTSLKSAITSLKGAIQYKETGSTTNSVTFDIDVTTQHLVFLAGVYRSSSQQDFGVEGYCLIRVNNNGIIWVTKKVGCDALSVSYSNGKLTVTWNTYMSIMAIIPRS